MEVVIVAVVICAVVGVLVSDLTMRGHVKRENAMRQYVHKELTDFAKANNLAPPFPPNRIGLG